MRWFSWENFSKNHAKNFLKILQSISPVRVYNIIVVDTPFWFNTFWNLISDFMGREFKQRFTITNRQNILEFVNNKS